MVPHKEVTLLKRWAAGLLGVLLLLTLSFTGCTADEAVYIQTPASDELSGALTVIDYPHHKLHEGDYFLTDYVDEALGNGDTLIIAFKTMVVSTGRAHMTGEFTTLVGGNIQIWEDPTWTTNTGVLVSILNRKREVVMKSSGLLEDLTATPVFTSTDNVLVNVTGLNTGAATRLHDIYAFAAQGRGAGGGGRDATELLLKSDTQYAIVFTSSGANNKAQILLNWYKHTDLE